MNLISYLALLVAAQCVLHALVFASRRDRYGFAISAIAGLIWSFVAVQWL